jgi:large subunit ribosomal protein L35
MPKAKTSKSIAGRIKVTKTGKVLRHHQNTSHMMVRRSRKTKRKLRKTAVVQGLIARNLKRAVGRG